MAACDQHMASCSVGSVLKLAVPADISEMEVDFRGAGRCATVLTLNAVQALAFVQSVSALGPAQEG